MRTLTIDKLLTVVASIPIFTMVGNSVYLDSSEEHFARVARENLIMRKKIHVTFFLILKKNLYRNTDKFLYFLKICLFSIGRFEKLLKNCQFFFVLSETASTFSIVVHILFPGNFFFGVTVGVCFKTHTIVVAKSKISTNCTFFRRIKLTLVWLKFHRRTWWAGGGRRRIFGVHFWSVKFFLRIGKKTRRIIRKARAELKVTMCLICAL